MNASKSSASNHTLSPPTRPTTLWVSSQLTRFEIDSLRQSKKLIADYVQKALPERLAKLSNLKQQVTV